MTEIQKSLDSLLGNIKEIYPEVIEFDTWKGDLAKHYAELAKVKGVIAEHQTKVSAHTAEIEALKAAKAQAQSEVDALVKERNAKHEELAKLDAALKKARPKP